MSADKTVDSMSERELFTISELARRSGTSPATIKHYVNEGLLMPVKKTGKTMAWYDAESVKRVELIRSLKEDRFLPLSVIKRLLRRNGLTDVSVELDHAIYPAPEVRLENRWYTTDELSRETGLSEEWIEELVNSRILHPGSEEGQVFSELDAKIAQIVKQREADGLSLQYSREVLKQYSAAIERAVYRDIRLFISMVLSDPDVSDPLRLFNRDDDSINLFLFYARRKFNRQFVNDIFAELDDFTLNVRTWMVIPPRELLANAEALDIEEADLEALRDIVAILEGSEVRADDPGEARRGKRSVPLARLESLLRQIKEFSHSGVLDHRLHFLLSDLEGVNECGTIPSDIFAASDKVLVETLLAAWLTGAIYLALPVTLGYRMRGLRILERVMAILKDRYRSGDSEGFLEVLDNRVVPTIRRKLGELYRQEEEHG